ncbi:uncharacterized protein LOC143191488 [Rhynchophorus ferrugineus]|uniref:uncharacterized protein LOC143191488 n=1 Tax=Rhynchophorus ferrugineus TaxID=354439 RepID=UPI003FCE03F0
MLYHWSVLFFTIIALDCVSVNGQDFSSEEIENEASEVRESREYIDNWRGIQVVPQPGSSGWIAQVSGGEWPNSLPLKRRRLRKRKRRPSTTEDAVRYGSVGDQDDGPTLEQNQQEERLAVLKDRFEQEENRYLPPKKRKRPNVNGEWDDDSEEASIPASQEPSIGNRASVEVQQTTSPESNAIPEINELKIILKQNGGFSLSELLQEKNLSLAELLMGNKNAINALTSSSPMVSSTEPAGTTRYQRVPPSVMLKKNTIDRRIEQTDDTADLAEMQRKRSNLLQKLATRKDPGPNRSIFVPSHPKLYTAINYKPGLNDFASPVTELYLPVTTMTTTTTTTTEIPTTTSTKRSLPLTNSKLTKLITKQIVEAPSPKKEYQQQQTVHVVNAEEVEEETENYPKLPILPPKPYKIDVNEIISLYKKESSLITHQDEPLRMNIDLEVTTQTPVTAQATTIQTMSYTEEGHKLQPFTAKEEILEILKDPKGREDLAKILEARNMTIQELIEQRERGSSQRHLADMFHNNTLEPEPVDEPLEGHVNTAQEGFPSFPSFPRKSKSLLEESTTQKPSPFPSYKIDAPTINLNSPWEELYTKLLDLESETVQAHSPPDDIIENDIQRLDDIENSRSYSSSASNEELAVVVDEDSNILFKHFPPAIKSAILGSLLILGLSLIVFVTILMIFKWTQKKKKRLCHRDSLKPPLFDVKPKKIKTFMVETLGKTKINYYKNQLQSDSIWDKGSERKLSF